MTIFLSDKDYAAWEREFESHMVATETFLNKLDKIPIVNYTSAGFRFGVGIGLIIAPSINIIGFVIQGIFAKHSLNLKDCIIKQLAYTDHGVANIIRASLVALPIFYMMFDPLWIYSGSFEFLSCVLCIIYDFQGWRFRYPIEKLTLEQTSLSLERA